MILISITSNERHTENINKELKILTAVDKSVKWCYISIVKNEFPERIGYQMLSELENRTLKTLNAKFFNLNQTQNSDVKMHGDDIQLIMVELYRKYKDPASSDRLISAMNDVNDIKIDMGKNMRSMFDNISNVEV